MLFLSAMQATSKVLVFSANITTQQLKKKKKRFLKSRTELEIETAMVTNLSAGNSSRSEILKVRKKQTIAWN